MSFGIIISFHGGSPHQSGILCEPSTYLFFLIGLSLVQFSRTLKVMNLFYMIQYKVKVLEC